MVMNFLRNCNFVIDFLQFSGKTSQKIPAALMTLSSELPKAKPKILFNFSRISGVMSTFPTALRVWRLGFAWSLHLPLEICTACFRIACFRTLIPWWWMYVENVNMVECVTQTSENMLKFIFHSPIILIIFHTSLFQKWPIIHINH